MNVKKIFWVIVALLLIVTVTTSSVFADCFTVLVGKDASVDGSVMWGHNEQNGGLRIVNYRVIPRIEYGPEDLVELRNGGTLPEVAETFSLIWLENTGISFSDAYFNEWGVVTGSDGCGTREDSYDELVARGDITDGGIEYMLRRLVAQRAKTAREGVEIAGELLNRFGYAASGRSLMIVDPNEAWVLSMVRGKHWVAQKCPDDEVVLLPNVHVIGEIDLEDTDNFIGSPADVKDYAIERGWYDPNSGKPFSFREAYNRIPSEGSFREEYGCDPRQWYAQSMVLGELIPLPVKEPLPFSIKPAHKLSVQDVKDIISSHLEGTEFDVTEEYKLGSPHDMRGIGRSICGESTQEGAVYQLRSWMPKEVGCLVWRTTGAPCSIVLTPWYLGITETPEIYYKPWEIEEQLKVSHHFDPPAGTFDYDPEFAFWAFNAVENLVDMNYKKGLELVRAVWDPFEAGQFAIQPVVEEIALKLFSEDETLARQFLTDYTSSRALLAVDKANKLSGELKTLFWAK